jgi:anaerobic selenocysteine-containing dehydrogenase
MYLAMMIVRFLHINDICDDKYLEEYASEFEEYYELTQTIRIKSMLENMDMSLGQLGDIIELVKDKKVAIVCGVGVQKYRDGADILRAIDSVAVALGLFGKEGCGVAYLGNSREHINSPFNTKAKRVSKVDTAFDEFKTVFIQGANPLSQMPDTNRVKNAIQHTQNVVYFGLYENETSSVADLIIPAKSFLEKNDIRTSYSHNAMLPMNKQIDSEIGISEYDLSAYLCKEFNVEIKEESEYLAHFSSFAHEVSDGSLEVTGRETQPYQDGFDTDDGEFLFLEEVDIDKKANKIKMNKNRHKKKRVSDELYLLTSKAPKSLNSQFRCQSSAYLHSDLGYKEDEEITITSSVGSVKLKVKLNDDLREDCILIYSGTLGVNNLTSSKHSYEGKAASYQEERVTIQIEEAL